MYSILKKICTFVPLIKNKIMKKIRLVLWAAALMSAFTFTSCLDENNDPIEYMSL